MLRIKRKTALKPERIATCKGCRKPLHRSEQMGELCPKCNKKPPIKGTGRC